MKQLAIPRLAITKYKKQTVNNTSIKEQDNWFLDEKKVYFTKKL